MFGRGARAGVAAMKPDLLSIVEAIHDLQGTDDTWFQQVADRALPSFGEGLGVLTWGFGLGEGGFRLVSRTLGGGSPDLFASLSRAQAMFEQAMPAVVKAHEKAVFGSGCRDVFGEPLFTRIMADSGLDRYGLEDVFGLTAHDPDGTGIGVAIPRRSVAALDARRLARGRRVAAHMLSGFRLRRALSRVREAVLTPSGRILHGEGAAQTHRAQDSLRHAAREIERARGRLRRLDPDEAISRWQALAAGRWTLVDSVESDGKRFVIAWRNEPNAPTGGALTRRETQVATMAAQGMAIKDIAYTLGLASSTVGTHIGSVMRKLKARSRADLVSLMRGGPR